jgi:hypothetical protein
VGATNGVRQFSFGFAGLDSDLFERPEEKEAFMAAAKAAAGPLRCVKLRPPTDLDRVVERLQDNAQPREALTELGRMYGCGWIGLEELSALARGGGGHVLDLLQSLQGFAMREDPNTERLLNVLMGSGLDLGAWRLRTAGAELQPLLQTAPGRALLAGVLHQASPSTSDGPLEEAQLSRQKQLERSLGEMALSMEGMLSSGDASDPLVFELLGTLLASASPGLREELRRATPSELGALLQALPAFTPYSSDPAFFSRTLSPHAHRLLESFGLRRGGEVLQALRQLPETMLQDQFWEAEPSLELDALFRTPEMRAQVRLLVEQHGAPALAELIERMVDYKSAHDRLPLNGSPIGSAPPQAISIIRRTDLSASVKLLTAFEANPEGAQLFLAERNLDRAGAYASLAGMTPEQLDACLKSAEVRRAEILAEVAMRAAAREAVRLDPADLARCPGVTEVVLAEPAAAGTVSRLGVDRLERVLAPLNAQERLLSAEVLARWGKEVPWFERLSTSHGVVSDQELTHALKTAAKRKARDLASSLYEPEVITPHAGVVFENPYIGHRKLGEGRFSEVKGNGRIVIKRPKKPESDPLTEALKDRRLLRTPTVEEEREDERRQRLVITLGVARIQALGRNALYRELFPESIPWTGVRRDGTVIQAQNARSLVELDRLPPRLRAQAEAMALDAIEIASTLSPGLRADDRKSNFAFEVLGGPAALDVRLARFFDPYPTEPTPRDGDWKLRLPQRTLPLP